ncbi:hypothetical protein GCM10028773_44530 [Spirosoma koreense]
MAQNLPLPTPIILSGELMYVHVYVNGQGPYNFILDTGSPGVGYLDAHLAKALNLKIVGYEQSSYGHHVQREMLVGVDKLSIGQATQAGLRVIVRDFVEKPAQLPIDGVLGRDFFTDYVLIIDGPAHQLILSKEALNPQLPGVVGYNKAFLVPGRVGSKGLLFNLDTGSDLPFHFPKELLTGIQYVDTPNQLTVTKSNITFVMQEAVVTDELLLGHVQLKGQKIYYSDKANQINVGSGFLKAHRISLDQRKRLVRIE